MVSFDKVVFVLIFIDLSCWRWFPKLTTLENVKRKNLTELSLHRDVDDIII